MLHGLLWLPLLLIFVLLTALGWLERRRQSLFRSWANGSELCKLDSSGAASLKDVLFTTSFFEIMSLPKTLMSLISTFFRVLRLIKLVENKVISKKLRL